jgi:hypothetical protein
MRKWRSLADKATSDKEIHQIIVPSPCRNELLRLAHEIPMAGHGGVRKTMDRISKHFWWPGIMKDVQSFCKSCHICQVAGKPNQKIPIAPLNQHFKNPLLK